MFIELVDLLRCPNTHADTWLVATVEHMEERVILEGVLGCPVCNAEYPVRRGVTYFAPPDEESRAAVTASPDAAMWLAAGLELIDPRAVSVLQGRWGAHAHLVRSLAPAHLVVLNPPTGFATGEGISPILSRTAPLAAASVGAIALDEYANDEMVSTLVRALRPGGRALGAAAAGVPPGVVVLARDENVWVAEREGAIQSMVTIGRRGRDRPPPL